jgi:hypothetical protein
LILDLPPPPFAAPTVAEPAAEIATAPAAVGVALARRGGRRESAYVGLLAELEKAQARIVELERELEQWRNMTTSEHAAMPKEARD